VRASVFVGSRFVAKYPEGGGNFWVPLQYVLGFLGAGVDAYWLEFLLGTGDAERDRHRIATFFAHTERMGIGARAVLLYIPEDCDGGRQELHSPAGRSAGEISARMRHGILINLASSIPSQCRAEFAFTVLYDIDPGMFQLWSTQSRMGVGEHDLHCTVGQSIGRPECRVPTSGVDWRPLWPLVHLPSWPRQVTAGRRYTTVTQWWNGGSICDIIDGELYEHSKRATFLEFADIPGLSSLELELAANITPGEVEDRALLAGMGWRLVHPHEVAGTPWQYRHYIQSSRGEFSCAKPSVIKTTPGWISDRTICYLASGRPCVVQAAGAERHLPQSLGLQFFNDKPEAVEALRAVERDYERACREARRLAEAFFATAVVIPKIMKMVGLSQSP
jgi:hypothetical protein